MNVATIAGWLAGTHRSIVADRHRVGSRRPARRRIGAWSLTIAMSLVAATLVAEHPASAQLMEGMTTLVAPFTIEANGQVVGRVVVVGAKNTDPPPGYTPGSEYWTWTTGRPWRGAFTLVPDHSVPNHQAYTWQTFPHERFDLSHTVPIPAVSPATRDAFYQVQIAAGTGWIDQGYMWLDVGSPTVQTWYGVALTHDLVGNGGPIRFRAVEPPAAGSTDVYLLQTAPTTANRWPGRPTS